MKYTDPDVESQEILDVRFLMLDLNVRFAVQSLVVMCGVAIHIQSLEHIF